MTAPSRPFVSDVTERRRRAREHIERGAITRNYGGDAQQTIDLLQTALATEIACVLRDTMHNIASVGIDSESVKAEFAEHARDEYEHWRSSPTASTSSAARRTSTPKACKRGPQ